MVTHACKSQQLKSLRQADSWSPGVQDHPGKHGKTPSLQEIQKLVGLGGAHLWSQLLWRLRWENCLNPGGRGCSEPTVPLHFSLGKGRDSVSNTYVHTYIHTNKNKKSLTITVKKKLKRHEY